MLSQCLIALFNNQIKQIIFLCVCVQWEWNIDVKFVDNNLKTKNGNEQVE